MASDFCNPMSIFYSYSHKDEDLRLELEAHLAALRRSGLIREWHDRKIEPGREWKSQIDAYLDSAELILFLISADFINSGYCMDVEVARALERHKRNEAVVVPVILRPVMWQVIPWLHELQALPKDGLPIIQWSPRDLAYVSVCEGILSRLHKATPPSAPKHISTLRARKRVLDAAIPARVPVNKPSALLVMVRRSDSLGLGGVVEAEVSYNMTKEDVKSKPVSLRFPSLGGVPKPLDLVVKVESPEFDPPSQSKTLHVPPRGDSEPRVFLLTPKREDQLMLNLELSFGDSLIAGCVLQTEGIPTEQEQAELRQNVASAAAPQLREHQENEEFNPAFEYDVFLSYNSARKEWARALARRLRNDQFRVFFDEWEMPKYIGKSLADVLSNAMEKTRRVLVVDDTVSVAEIGSVEFEFYYQQLLYSLDNSRPYEGDFEQFAKMHLLSQNADRVFSADRPPLVAEDQTRQLLELRSVLYQVPRYSTPTYFLDSHLAVVSWNVAFELIFKPILPAIRRRHVNCFIVELANRDDVFDHAKDFREELKDGQLPLVDMEPLIYESPKYGRVEFIKIATQLTDRNAEPKAWAVSLLLKKIDWTLYLRDLEIRLREDRLWGIYAVSYDAILRSFQPYQDLIQDVIGALPSSPCRVLELGAGTGNVTERLLERSHSVLAVENNPFMLEKMEEKGLCAGPNLTVQVESIDNTQFDDRGNFDAAVAVDVAYALEDPLRCFRKVSGVLKPGGIFALSTMHSDTKLDALLEAIRADLELKRRFWEHSEHYERIVSVNRTIEKTMARRHSIKQYREWILDAGFQILSSEPKYFDAVEVIHARKL